ncbi:ribosomal protein S5 (plastid) [Cryptomonas paramecium]|uniref:Small ribosomal subunit protein uS5c n=1 Tax=Cryptomonas paramaecium TaxID=2898 RepID=D2ISB0_9CRYP|nr:ribosomal protein S5 [Cryptomonas paramecium]ACT46802.1 ribosomal protein S5 [Cryptomonas paramecium]BDA97993.1 ribosomal protein S5 [Cryptomonas paramecium]|mmetsp:Transcript_62695/g.168023  ORF Transcript_62695/g.168023 Transcript_62695/m.168023 type:complete len:170 (-) Transcript_62695:967-1476(-)
MLKQKRIAKSHWKNSEWQEKILQVNRVTKVVKGGKKLSFRVVMIIGNRKGSVGVGLGKANDVASAVKKAGADAKKHILTIPISRSDSIPHMTMGKAGAASVIIRPSSPGSGVTAGGSLGMILRLAGVRNVLAKRLGSSNLLNNAHATVDALSKVKTIVEIKQIRTSTST